MQGATCRYAHGEHELRTVAQNQAAVSGGAAIPGGTAATAGQV
jgi:hypothetical protein